MYMYNSALHSKDNMIEPGQFLKINSVSNYNTEPEMGLLEKKRERMVEEMLNLCICARKQAGAVKGRPRTSVESQNLTSS